MKKTILSFLVLTAAACNNTSNEARGHNDDSAVRSAPAVENVNGNIPDSTNTIDVGTNDGAVSQ